MGAFATVHIVSWELSRGPCMTHGGSLCFCS